MILQCRWHHAAPVRPNSFFDLLAAATVSHRFALAAQPFPLLDLHIVPLSQNGKEHFAKVCAGI